LRATGSIIKTINVESQGVVPFLKIANDVVAAINRSGSRRGAQVVYLETWHYDIEDFLDLRRNTGDERRRTHEMNTANWIPDLFMKRVLNNGNWTLFSPDDVPDLHEKVGKAFEEAYVGYEEKARRGEIRLYKVLEANQLWRKMLSRLFETGHPWVCFKDPCNLRSPQDHCGVVHSSNLCTEITLNTSREETAVCNLGSINLPKFIKDGKFDTESLEKAITTAVRMLDNTIDVNFYPTKEAEVSNMRHRPLGLGIMGFQDALFTMDLAFEDQKTLEVNDLMMETISYYAILASSKLAEERGAYKSYKGSKWDRNLFPIDTLDVLEQERGMKIEVDRTSRLDWTPVREHVRQHGMRNSNIMAIAPTATISNISGCFPCIEPVFKNMYVKANMSGEFAVINEFLVNDLKKLGLWNQEMVDQIKYYDGSVQRIDAIPDRLKQKHKESFEIDPILLMKLTALRGKWIDQSQSHNVFMSGVSGKLLHEIYTTGWKYGLKTFYYLRTLGASQIEKSTLDANKFGFTQKREYAAQNPAETASKSCGIEDTDCESCQ
jgi:ribonucleoside-diphosphate reductase alpha chain